MCLLVCCGAEGDHPEGETLNSGIDLNSPVVPKMFLMKSVSSAAGFSLRGRVRSTQIQRPAREKLLHLRAERS